MNGIISILPQLEPVCGAGFAVGVAYLNLERFRYRNKIRQQANKYKTDLSKSSKYKKLEELNLDGVALISYLSGLQDHDPMGDNNGKNQSKVPDNAGWACTVYNLFFRKHVDRKICLVTSFLSFCGLLLGVLYSSELTSWLKGFFDSPVGGWIAVVVLALCTAIPLMFVWMGSSIVKRLSKNAKSAFDQIAGILKADIIAEATVKDN